MFDSYMYDFLKTIPQGNRKNQLVDRLFPTFNPSGIIHYFFF